VLKLTLLEAADRLHLVPAVGEPVLLNGCLRAVVADKRLHVKCGEGYLPMVLLRYAVGGCEWVDLRFAKLSRPVVPAEVGEQAVLPIAV
jgi:hypothetical protein